MVLAVDVKVILTDTSVDHVYFISDSPCKICPGASKWLERLRLGGAEIEAARSLSTRAERDAILAGAEVV